MARKVKEQAAKGVFFVKVPGHEAQEFQGYTLGQTWKGYACPMFEKAEAEKIMAHNSSEFDTVSHYDELMDVFRWHPAPKKLGERDFAMGMDIPFNGEMVHVYPIGYGRWAWQQK